MVTAIAADCYTRAKRGCASLVSRGHTPFRKGFAERGVATRD